MSSETAVSTLSHGKTRRPRRGIDYWTRSQIKKRLEGLTAGRLTVMDPWGEWSVGERTGLAADLLVANPGFFRTLALEGELGAARAYMNGHWQSSQLTNLFRILLRNTELLDGLEGNFAAVSGAVSRLRHLLNRNTRTGSKKNIHAHYDLGNDFFALFLDPTRTYSAGIFEQPTATLEQASISKLDRICRKLSLRPEDKVIEIGTGWGSFALHAASRYGCHVTTTTISAEQFDYASERVRERGLEDRITLLRSDYRDLQGKFDKLVSIEMIEAVGHEYLPQFFGKCADLLRQDGAMLIQAITMPDQRYDRYLKNSDFIRRYIFPGSCVPSLSAIIDAMRGSTDLSLAHLEDIGPHYATTLRAWRERFVQKLDAVRNLGYPPEFQRMWLYYLHYCEAGFAERYLGTLQLLFSKPRCEMPPLLGAV
ncbi:MAG: cyclopropane-fatty-acyl-phospholipid synthase family protein [Gammaproteobacteria bacterium]|nr:cyclopropane-fatty-acyl-phospholipid synthase family protein [Gammaproteobacteria bacterium]MDH3410887.1 cyclopropane-fatty-acyl-phospholipid synthase family protein [Gammaproteobacteria bacterium]